MCSDIILGNDGDCKWSWGSNRHQLECKIILNPSTTFLVPSFFKLLFVCMIVLQPLTCLWLKLKWVSWEKHWIFFLSCYSLLLDMYHVIDILWYCLIKYFIDLLWKKNEVNVDLYKKWGESIQLWSNFQIFHMNLSNKYIRLYHCTDYLITLEVGQHYLLE